MYEEHWKLRAKPFENDLDTSFFYPSREHREALVRLLYAVSEGKGCALLTGEPGCGKTFLLHRLAAELAERGVRVALIKNPASEPLDLLRQIARALGVRNADTSKSDLVAALEQFLVYHRARGSRAVVLIDDADVIDDERAYEELRLLLNLESGGRGLLTLVLAGPARLTKIVRRVPGLAQRVAVSASLPPLGGSETSGYIAHRLGRAQGRPEIFDRRALSEIHRASGGVPRLINHICDLSLLIGASEGSQRIDARIVERAQQEIRDLRG
ncbi:MAG: ATPase [Planctomycetota bacterium]|nr:MAG: ATPase [Planctomycetota bacterium]